MNIVLISWFLLWVIVSNPFPTPTPIRQALFALVLILMLVFLLVGVPVVNLK